MPLGISRWWAAAVLVAVLPACSSAAATQPGRQLSASLVPVSALPPGYRPARNLQYNSGDRLETGPVKYDLAAMSCAAVADADGRAGFGESALAEGFDEKLAGAHGTGLGQEVYQFRAAKEASSFWEALRAALIRCPGFGEATSTDPGKLVQRVLAVGYGRDRAFEVLMTENGPRSGLVNWAMLVVAAGEDVFTVDTLGYGQPVPADPSARTLLGELTARVQAAQLGRPGRPFSPM